MPLDTSSGELRFALDAVRKASLLAQTVQAELNLMKLTKEDTSPVTVADFACQAVVAKTLSDAFPASVLVGEEGASELRRSENSEVLEAVSTLVSKIIPGATAEKVCDWIDLGAAEPSSRYWTLDPIDGTKGYLRGDQYAIALALIHDGEVALGVLGCPNLANDCSLHPANGGVVLAAVKGEGAWSTPLHGNGGYTHLRVSGCGDIRGARLLRSLVSSHTNVDQMQEFATQMGLESEPVALDSQAKYAMLAAGNGELMLRLLSPKQPDYKELIWDQAAGSIIVEEAGGKVTDLDGRALDFTHGRRLESNRGVCATNGVLHDAVLDALSALAG